MDLLSSAVIVDKNGRRCDIKDILKVMKLKLQRGGGKGVITYAFKIEISTAKKRVLVV